MNNKRNKSKGEDDDRKRKNWNCQNEDKREKHFKLEYHLTFTQTHRAVMLFYFQDMFEIYVLGLIHWLARSLARAR